MGVDALACLLSDCAVKIAPSSLGRLYTSGALRADNSARVPTLVPVAVLKRTWLGDQLAGITEAVGCLTSMPVRGGLALLHCTVLHRCLLRGCVLPQCDRVLCTDSSMLSHALQQVPYQQPAQDPYQRKECVVQQVVKFLQSQAGC